MMAVLAFALRTLGIGVPDKSGTLGVVVERHTEWVGVWEHVGYARRNGNHDPNFTGFSSLYHFVSKNIPFNTIYREAIVDLYNIEYFRVSEREARICGSSVGLNKRDIYSHITYNGNSYTGVVNIEANPGLLRRPNSVRYQGKILNCHDGSIGGLQRSFSNVSGFFSGIGSLHRGAAGPLTVFGEASRFQPQEDRGNAQYEREEGDPGVWLKPEYFSVGGLLAACGGNLLGGRLYLYDRRCPRLTIRRVAGGILMAIGCLLGAGGYLLAALNGGGY